MPSLVVLVGRCATHRQLGGQYLLSSSLADVSKGGRTPFAAHCLAAAGATAGAFVRVPACL